MNLELQTSSMSASYTLAIAKASIRVEGRLNNNSRQIASFIPVMKKLMRGLEIPITLSMRSTNAAWKSETEPV